MAFHVLSKANLLHFQFFLHLIISTIVLAKNDSTKLMYRKPVAVHGYVYCKACQHIGVDALDLEDAIPLAGALVRLECEDKQNPIIQETNTTRNGYFSIKTEQPLTTLQFEQCKVTIVSSPSETCNVPTDMNGGVSGTFLKLSHKVFAATNNNNQKTRHNNHSEVFAVGPFAFQSAARLETCSTVRVLQECDPSCAFICSNGACQCSYDDCGEEIIRKL